MGVEARLILASVSTNESVSTATPWVPLDVTPEGGVAVAFGIAGACGRQYRVQHTFTNLMDRDATDYATPYAFVHSEATAVQADFNGNYTVPPRAVRLQRTSAASTVSGRSSVTFFVNQAG